MDVIQHSWLVPSFLEGFRDSEIVFFGAIPFILLFGLFNYKNLSLSSFLFIGGLIYVLSLGTGVGLGETGLVDNDTEGACVAGLWAPIVYSILMTIVLHKTNIISTQSHSDLDHFIDS